MILVGKTDVGKVRTSNQDYFSFQQLPDDRCFVVVCDGMGGYKGGNIASEIAVNTAIETLTELLSGPYTDIELVITEAIKRANRAVFIASLKNEELSNMGTTMVVAYMDKTNYAIANVGDSRAYLLRKGEFTQLSHDQSLVQSMVDSGTISAEEARTHPYKNVVTQVIGRDTSPQINFAFGNSMADDLILVCTDGLTNMLKDEEISEKVKSFERIDEDVCASLIESANEHGGTDNITVAILQNN